MSMRQWRIKEWHRTIVLIVLLLLAVGFLWWSNHEADVNFTQTF